MPYKSYKIKFLKTKDGEHLSIWPYFECRLMPGVFGNACGNYFYFVKTGRYYFRLNKYKDFRGTFESNQPPTDIYFNYY